MKSLAPILIVDDFIEYREMLELVLSEDYPNLFFAENGQMAIEILKQESIALIITDLDMPGSDGKWLLSQLKNLYTIPVIVVSASAMTNEKDLQDLGARALVQKPFPISNLIEIIDDYILS